ncbi:MAG: hypothetical protein DI598_07715 [Pseudopedobacter saltans]|uniref:Gliding motility protein GldN n=1 Tax=Pseudopedobacter saltans TaxID=151895 RepID=A0A2W5GUF7_9SPHI|nr:MAG: hypothetical protein DI598_07715 [Pseudopedobacter saltans]
MKLILLICLSVITPFAKAQNNDSIFSDTANKLNPITIQTNKYRADSISNREYYKKAFNYKSPKINMGDNKWDRTIIVAGKKIALDPQKSLSLLDIDALIEVVHSKKKKQKIQLQKRLVDQEKDKYVRQIFTPALVEKYSNIHNEDSINIFINRYAPGYGEIQTMNELDLGYYIFRNMKLFQGSISLTV